MINSLIGCFVFLTIDVNSMNIKILGLANDLNILDTDIKSMKISIESLNKTAKILNINEKSEIRSFKINNYSFQKEDTFKNLRMILDQRGDQSKHRN